MAGRAIDAYSFRNNADIVTKKHEGLIIINIVVPELNDLSNNYNVIEIVRGATCDTSHALLYILNERFEGIVISLGEECNWPPTL